MRRAGRLLICGPMAPAQGVGGLQTVLTDLVEGLAGRGWDIDTLPVPIVTDWRGAATWRSTLAATLRRHLPDAQRLLGRLLLYDLGHLREQSDLLRDLEGRIVGGGYSAVVACVDNAPVGVASLVTRLARRHVLISLSALTSELHRRHSIAAVGRMAQRASGGLHPDLLRPVNPAAVQAAVFASQTWRNAGVAAGLEPEATSAIYFGVRAPVGLPRAQAPRTPLRLLWAARLAPEKGLHLFLPAVALVRRVMPVRLTVIDAGGPASYRRSTLRTIQHLGLDGVVRFEPAVARERLPGILAAHDVYLFHSMFAEPVAQMLLHAFAAGTLVVAPAPSVPSVIKPGETAICFGDEHPATIAQAIVQATRDEAARHRLRARAFAVVTAEQSLEGTITDYDHLLTALTGERLQARA